MFCEQCGLTFIPKQSVCSGCERPPTRHWLQLVGLTTLTLALGLNALIASVLLPRLVESRHASAWLGGWLWVNEQLSALGWAVIAAGLLLWAYWPRYGYQPEKEMKAARLLLILVLAAGAVGLVLPLVSAGSLLGAKAALLANAKLAAGGAWGLVVLAVALLCGNAETRDLLLGDGRALSLVSLGVLALMLGLVVLGWSAG
ncbi:MAG: hypothetical protein ACE5HB_04245 [Terriglobia bacterium]